MRRRSTSLRKLFFLYAFLLCVVMITVVWLLYQGFLLGESLRLYTFANEEEKVVENLKKRIEEKKTFIPGWVPAPIRYTEFDQEGRILSSNGTEKEQQRAKDLLRGGPEHFGRDFLTREELPGGQVVFQYHIGTRYLKDWANRSLPSVELLFLLGLLFQALWPVVLFISLLSRRLQREMVPLKKSIHAIAEGDLDLPVPPLRIEEFDRLGALLERMRIELKTTLQCSWIREHAIEEEITGMLHDLHSPLTVAQAKTTFLREDLLHMGGEQRGQLLEEVEQILFHLERIGEVTGRFDERLLERERPATCAPRVVWDQLASFLHAYGKGLGISVHTSQEGEGILLGINLLDGKQIFGNLLLNAYEYGGNDQRIDVTVSPKPSHVELRFTNTGSSFSAEALRHATEKGYSEKEKGNQGIQGVGLYVARRLLKEVDGDLCLSNTADGYACVAMRIPHPRFD